MRAFALPFVLFALTGLAVAGDCLSVDEAPKKVGEIACVKGTVVKVGESRTGNFYLDFCKDYKACPFTVFIPGKSLRDIGDVRQLEGKTIEVHGKIQQYNGRAEIILKDIGQLKGEASNIPPVPKDFDASRKGNFSAGKFSESKASHTHGQPPTSIEPKPAQE